MAAFQYGAASFQWWGKYLFEYITTRASIRAAKREKKEDTKPSENPRLFLTYLRSNHSKVCPPIAFVDENDTEVRV